MTFQGEDLRRRAEEVLLTCHGCNSRMRHESLDCPAGCGRRISRWHCQCRPPEAAEGAPCRVCRGEITV